MTEPLSPERLAEMQQRHARHQRSHSPRTTYWDFDDCFAAAESAADVPDLLAEVERLNAELDQARTAWQWLQIRADVEHHAEYPDTPHDGCRCRGCWLTQQLGSARDVAPGVIAHRALKSGGPAGE